VKPSSFAYAKTRSLDETIGLLEQHRDEARIIAGGQSLMALLNLRLSAPKLLVDINGIAGLDGIALDGGDLKIGALVRHSAAQKSPLVARHAPLLALALPHVAHPAIRNRGTVGGSIALADPAAELPACLLALGGAVEIAGPGGMRTVAADDFFQGLYQTALGPDEVLTAIRLPAAGETTRVAFAELARRHGDFALLGLAASARAEGDRLEDLRLAFLSVALTPVRARRAETVLNGQRLGSLPVDEAVAALADDLDPDGDIHASREMKMHLAGVLLRRVAAQLERPVP
jgi:carbon-monoxide dehydrogenase medium subunit